MKVSLNTIKQYVDIDLTVDELVARINEQLGQVEEVIDYGEKYRDVVVVKVVSCEKHPDADKLSVCLVNDGGVVDEVERTEDGLVQVVCGAPNVATGIFAAWLPPKSVVPATYGTNEPFVLGSRELRGVKSNGMLAALDELDLGNDHEGIVILDENEWNPSGALVSPGASFAAIYGLDDTVLDIENKMFTHRPDCFGVLGVAREIAGITHVAFTEPEWYAELPRFESANGLELSVINDAPSVVPRFMAVAFSDVEVKPSPLWMQCELVRLGSKSINNIVDVTNYIMLLSGQPLHAYDYDKVGKTIGARYAKQGEALTLINGKNYTLVESDIVITDGVKPIGLAGVMGGSETEVTQSTKNIILECANFDMYSIRRSSMRHGIFSDAVTRFNKGQSSLQQPYVINLAMKSILDVAGGMQASDVYDISGTVAEPNSVSVTSEYINARLGTKLTNAEIISLLENVSITVDQQSEQNSPLTIHPPFWRTDIEEPEDLVEEVGRLYGYDKLPLELPMRSGAPVKKNESRELKQTVRSLMRLCGAHEVLTYSFVHERVINSAQQPTEQSYKIANALSPDLQYYRQTVLPSLLDKVYANSRAGYDEFCLYEIGKGHRKDAPVDDAGLPAEQTYIDGVYTSKNNQPGAPYYRARRIVEELFDGLGIPIQFTQGTFDNNSQAISAPFESSRSAQIVLNETVIGIVGEFKQAVRKAFKLSDYTAGFTIDFDALLGHGERSVMSHYRPLSKYPSVSQDVTIKTPLEVPFSTIQSLVNSAILSVAGELEIRVQPVGIYKPESEQTKNTTFHVDVTSYNKTLTDDEVSGLIEAVASDASRISGAVV